MATTTGTPQLVPFAGRAAGSASYSAATEVFDSLSYTSLAAGTVTLSPQIVPSATGYWSLSTPGNSTTTQSTYAPVTAVASQCAALPVLVIDLARAVTAQPVISLAISTNTAPGSYGTNEGDLQVTDSHGNYFPGEIQVTPAATSYLTITGFPEGDVEIYAFDVLVNGVEANPTQIATLINAINGTDGGAPASPGVAAVSNTWAGLGLGGPNPFPPGSSSPWNLYVDMGYAQDWGTGTATYLGWDVSNEDPNLVGYTIEQVGAVPEPMSLSLLALGGVGVMARRNRRIA